MKKIIFADKFEYSLVKKVGFDGVFVKYDGDEQVERDSGSAYKEGLILSSIHAPSKFCNLIYTDNPTPYIEQLKHIITLASRLKIEYVITHASLHIDTPPYNPIAIERYKKLFDFSFERGVKLCIENLEHPHAVYLLKELSTYHGGGFCLDTGHNNAYTPQTDYSEFTPIYLHLNDNLGMTGKTYDGIDDLHLIPYDGNAHFDKICRTLKAQGYSGDLTLELKKRNSNLYDGLTDEQFLLKAYSVAKRLENMIKG